MFFQEWTDKMDRSQLISSRFLIFAPPKRELQMSLQKRKEALATLGLFLSQFSRKKILRNDQIPYNDLFFEAFSTQIKRAQEFNGWFTEDNVLFAVESWGQALRIENIDRWTAPYALEQSSPKTIAVIMAGNIPMVGFHDCISVLISGHALLAKLSSNDAHFLPILGTYLGYLLPEFKEKIQFTEEKLEKFDAVIATGSDNTARYFDYYFGKYPHIIRHNRNSVAVLSGAEDTETLEKMGEDVFRYFGLGCRSISKVYLPKDFDLDRLFKAVYKHRNILQYTRYKNNYDYNKAIYIMSQYEVLENGFLMLVKDSRCSSPIATLFYEHYENLESLKSLLAAKKDTIQCISSELDLPGSIPLGGTQTPSLWDYADGKDTLQFLSTLP